MTRTREILGQFLSALGPHPAPPSVRRPRKAAPVLDSLEDRVVLSGMGHHRQAIAARLAAQVGSASAGAGTTSGGDTSAVSLAGCTGLGGATRDAQLTADLAKLRTDLNAAIAGSAVTDAQRLALGNDMKALSQAGVTVDKAALKTVAHTLLTALADGSYDANQAAIQASFTAAFTGTSGAALTTDQAALVSTAYTDFVAVARGLNLDSTELTTLAADRAAIEADLARLGIGSSDGHAPGQSANLDLILGNGPGGFGGRGGGFGRGPGFGRRGGRR